MPGEGCVCWRSIKLGGTKFCERLFPALILSFFELCVRLQQSQQDPKYDFQQVLLQPLADSL